MTRPPKHTTKKEPTKARPRKASSALAELALGEDSTRQFKRDVTNGDALAAEMVAFANAEGGTLFLGVADDGTTPGLSTDDVKRLNQLIGNTANHSDKRRVNAKEELRRLFQITDPFHADELPTKAGVDALDELRFRDFLRDTYGQKLPARAADRRSLLANMNLATDAGVLNLAGLLLFSEQPQRFKPQFVVKAVKYPGTDIHTSKYDDTEDFIFDDRIEIISPGTLPNHLTVENIRAGNSNLRNPIVASFVAKGVLPYRGLGSGVPRALEAWPDIDFRDDRDGVLFVATVRRRAPPADLRGTATAQVTAQVLALVQQIEGELTRGELQEAVGITHREHFRKAHLLPALEAGLIEMTQPDKPNSRRQRYRLTPTGKELRARRGTTKRRMGPF